MIALFNLNNYLGGGETIFTRWADYLYKHNEEFLLFYPAKSFIAEELYRLGIPSAFLCPYKGDANYYYLSRKERECYVNYLYSKLKCASNVKLVSFCFRDLFTLVDLAKKDASYTITHLILHDEDNKYVCQTLYDKILHKLGGRRRFSNLSQLEFNNQLLRSLVASGGLIAEKMTTKIVMSKYGVDINDAFIVPPPMCDFPQTKPFVESNKKIIWLGRIVDFKLPAICSMLDFVCRHKDYSLTLVGDGELSYLKNYMKDRHLDDSNINFAGLIPYNEISSIIKQHSIGYACGTSIVEIGQYGLPVITALASPTHKLFRKSICGGIYDNKYKGNEGNNLFIGETEDEQPLIENVMNEIESDFHGAALKSYKAMKADFDFTTNITQYMNIIFQTKSISKIIAIPYSSSIRKILFNLFKNQESF